MFKYLRILSIVSLVVVIVIATLSGILFRSTALDDLTVMVEKNNTSLAQGYINTVWKNYREVIVPLAADPAQLKNSPQVAQFAQDTVRYFEHMPAARVNLYSPTGALLMSVNGDGPDKLAGASSSPNSAFVSSHLQRSRYDSQVLDNIALQNGMQARLIQTVIPLHDGPKPGAEGVLEVLYNVTDSWGEVVEFQMLSTGGTILFFFLFLVILGLASQKAEAIITKQHEANVDLAAAATTAQAENQDKSMFLANITHELRTPLNAIIGFSDIIKNEVIINNPDKKYHDYINDIHSSGVHLLSLINDILDYSKAEAGKLDLEVSEVNAAKMIQNCIRLVGPRAESGQVKLLENLPKEPLTLVTDSKKFKQILLNLLSNAVKFTPAGGEILVTSWQNVVDDMISFSVSDTGIGISPKDISRAMAPFGQVDNSLKRKYEGTGLGLPLTKKIVEFMGGKFTIESEVGAGTKIIFSLPREIKPRDGVIIKRVE